MLQSMGSQSRTRLSDGTELVCRGVCYTAGAQQTSMGQPSYLPLSAWTQLIWKLLVLRLPGVCSLALQRVFPSEWGWPLLLSSFLTRADVWTYVPGLPNSRRSEGSWASHWDGSPFSSSLGSCLTSSWLVPPYSCLQGWQKGSGFLASGLQA